jgi:hypothetical protein
LDSRDELIAVTVAARTAVAAAAAVTARTAVAAGAAVTGAVGVAAAHVVAVVLHSRDECAAVVRADCELTRNPGGQFDASRSLKRGGMGS